MLSISLILILVASICFLEIQAVPRWTRGAEKIFRKTEYSAVRKNSQESQNPEVGLDFTNFIREDHNTPVLKLCSKLETLAQSTAEKLAFAEDFDNIILEPTIVDKNENITYSQNVFNFTDDWWSKRPKIAIFYSTAAFYEPVHEYNYTNPIFASSFTRLIWKSSTDFGIGIASNGNRTIVVANYAPASPDVVTPENLKLFMENVLPEVKVEKAPFE